MDLSFIYKLKLSLIQSSTLFYSYNTIATNKTIDVLIETIRTICMHFQQNAKLIKLVHLSMAKEFESLSLTQPERAKQNFLCLKIYDSEDQENFRTTF